MEKKLKKYFIGGALQGAAGGAALGPWGMAGGAVLGGVMDLMNQRKMKQMEEEQRRREYQINKLNAEQQSMLNQSLYPTKGVQHTVNPFMAAYGTSLKALSGGGLMPVNSDTALAVGKKHNQGGIDIANPVGQPIAEVEGGEYIQDNDKVFSARYPDLNQKIAKLSANKAKLEKKGQVTPAIAKYMDFKSNEIFAEQEARNQMLGMGGNLNQYAVGGALAPALGLIGGMLLDKQSKGIGNRVGYSEAIIPEKLTLNTNPLLQSQRLTNQNVLNNMSNRQAAIASMASAQNATQNSISSATQDINNTNAGLAMQAKQQSLQQANLNTQLANDTARENAQLQQAKLNRTQDRLSNFINQMGVVGQDRQAMLNDRAKNKSAIESGMYDDETTAKLYTEIGLNPDGTNRNTIDEAKRRAYNLLQPKNVPIGKIGKPTLPNVSLNTPIQQMPPNYKQAEWSNVLPNNINAANYGMNGINYDAVNNADMTIPGGLDIAPYSSMNTKTGTGIPQELEQYISNMNNKDLMSLMARIKKNRPK